jgi:hypothetical protein
MTVVYVLLHSKLPYPKDLQENSGPFAGVDHEHTCNQASVSRRTIVVSSVNSQYLYMHCYKYSICWSCTSRQTLLHFQNHKLKLSSWNQTSRPRFIQGAISRRRSRLSFLGPQTTIAALSLLP